MRTAPVLEARDELNQQAQDAVVDGRFVPLELPGVFLAFIQQQDLWRRT